MYSRQELLVSARVVAKPVSVGNVADIVKDRERGQAIEANHQAFQTAIALVVPKLAQVATLRPARFAKPYRQFRKAVAQIRKSGTDISEFRTSFLTPFLGSKNDPQKWHAFNKTYCSDPNLGVAW